MAGSFAIRCRSSARASSSRPAASTASPPDLPRSRSRRCRSIRRWSRCVPSKTSTSWPKLRSSGAFCINVLSAQQKTVCDQFAKPGQFADIGWRRGVTGSPVLDGIIAYIDCDLEAEHDARRSRHRGRPRARPADLRRDRRAVAVLSWHVRALRDVHLVGALRAHVVGNSIMFKTRVCDILGIEYPIVLAGMGGASTPELAAAVSNAGGLGVLGAAGCGPKQLREWIRRTRELTDKPFGVDTLLPASVRRASGAHTDGPTPLDLLPEMQAFAAQFMATQHLEPVDAGDAAAAPRSGRAGAVVEGILRCADGSGHRRTRAGVCIGARQSRTVDDAPARERHEGDVRRRQGEARGAGDSGRHRHRRCARSRRRRPQFADRHDGADPASRRRGRRRAGARRRRHHRRPRHCGGDDARRRRRVGRLGVSCVDRSRHPGFPETGDRRRGRRRHGRFAQRHRQAGAHHPQSVDRRVGSARTKNRCRCRIKAPCRGR